jgi:hypothetical protein
VDDARASLDPRRADDVPRPRAAVEAVLVGAAGALFTWLHTVVARDVLVATANARTVRAIERAVRLDAEVPANAWLVGHPALAVLAALVYRLYYVALVAVLVWVWLRHRDTFVAVRRTLLTMAALCLVVYWAVPLSPPRFAVPGVVDVVALHDVFGRPWDGVPHAAGSYTAMPSMHVGWTLWCAYAVWIVLRRARPWAALAAWGLPAAMALVVIGTGNHYVLDVVGSVLLLAVSVLVNLRRPGRRGPPPLP